MNDSMLWDQAFRYYEHLRVVDDMNDYILWAQGSRYYEQLKAMDDMNDWGHQLKALYAMNNSVLWLRRKTIGREPRA